MGWTDEPLTCVYWTRPGGTSPLPPPTLYPSVRFSLLFKSVFFFINPLLGFPGCLFSFTPPLCVVHKTITAGTSCKPHFSSLHPASVFFFWFPFCRLSSPAVHFHFGIILGASTHLTQPLHQLRSLQISSCLLAGGVHLFDAPGWAPAQTCALRP